MGKRTFSGKEGRSGNKIFFQLSKINPAELVRTVRKFIESISEERLCPVPVPFLEVMGADGRLNQALHYAFGFPGQRTPEILPNLVGLEEPAGIKLRNSQLEFLLEDQGSRGHPPRLVS